jgi:hypothetical protein
MIGTRRANNWFVTITKIGRRRFRCAFLIFHIRNDFSNLIQPQQLLLIHGTGDQVTSYKASQAFYDNVEADDKKLILYEVSYISLPPFFGIYNCPVTIDVPLDREPIMKHTTRLWMGLKKKW